MNIDDIPVSNIYSPYHLVDYQKCPRLWSYKKRWQVRGMEQKAAMLIGSAVALGLEAHYDGKGRNPVETAVSYARANYYADSDRSEEGVVTLVRRGVKHGMATNLGLSEILGVEKAYGNIRPDIVGRNLAGCLCVVDHKVKLSLDDYKKELELLSYETLNQLMHYAWAVGQEYGEPVGTAIIHMIVLAPRVYTELHPVPIDQERLGQWLESAARDWKDMAKGEDRQRYASCIGRLGASTYQGKCEFWDACHVLNGHESDFHVLYDQKPERKV